MQRCHFEWCKGAASPVSSLQLGSTGSHTLQAIVTCTGRPRRSIVSSINIPPFHATDVRTHTPLLSRPQHVVGITTRLQVVAGSPHYLVTGCAKCRSGACIRVEGLYCELCDTIVSLHRALCLSPLAILHESTSCCIHRRATIT